MNHFLTRSFLLLVTLALPIFPACSDDDGSTNTPVGGAGGNAGKAGAPGEDGGVAGAADGGSDSKAGAPGEDGGAANGGADSKAGAPGEDGGVAGAAGGGDGDSSTPPTCNDGKWIIGGWTTTLDAYQGYLHTLDDLTAAGSIDFGKVNSFAGDFTYTAYPDGVTFVGQDGKSTIEKWQAEDDGSWTKVGQVDLLNQGVTSTLSGHIQRVNDTKGYYFDTGNNQVVGFNPETMLHDGVVIDLTPAFDVPSDFMQMTRVQREGDVFIVAARFWNEDFSVKKLIKAAIIDSSDDSVAFAEDTRCGDVFYPAIDSAGNVYFGSHVASTSNRIAGNDDSSESCIVRIKKGEKQFDADYYVDMDEVLGSIGATLIDGPGDLAFIEKYVGPVTDDFREARLGSYWDVYSITLGDEANTAAKVELPEPTIAYGNGFVTSCEGRETGFLVLSGPGWETGQIFQVIDATTVEPGLEYTGSFLDATRFD